MPQACDQPATIDPLKRRNEAPPRRCTAWILHDRVDRDVLPILTLLLASGGPSGSSQDANRPAPPRQEDPAEIARRAGADREAKEKLLRSLAEQGILLDAERGRIEIEGRPNGRTLGTLTFRVEARGAGSFPIMVTLQTPDGESTVGTGDVQVRSSAVSAVTLMATAGGALFLVVAWARRAVSRRTKQAPNP